MASPTPSKPNHLEPSRLGTKEYWDDLYTTELRNHTLNPSDEGTIWFDDSAAEDKVLSFLEEQILEKKILGDEVSRSNCSFLDLGTGNGHFLFRLREGAEEEDDGDGGGETEGENSWRGRMLGVDYSERSVEFARRIARDKGYAEGEGREVEFQWWDIMSQPSSMVLSGTSQDTSRTDEKGFDVVLDKGTFDAISLSEEKDERGRRICEGYKDRIVPLIREGGIFLVTSCNWTEEELTAWFVGHELEVVDKIWYKVYSFGGKKGSAISSVCFKKRVR